MVKNRKNAGDCIQKKVPGSSPLEEPGDQSLEKDEPVVLCRSCANMVAFLDHRIQKDDSFNHTFANPHGHVFEITCFSQAKGCSKASPESDDFSWFQGYLWAVGICRNCQSQLGWIFSSNQDRFYGLILEQLIFP